MTVCSYLLHKRPTIYGKSATTWSRVNKEKRLALWRDLCCEPYRAKRSPFRRGLCRCSLTGDFDNDGLEGGCRGLGGYVRLMRVFPTESSTYYHLVRAAASISTKLGRFRDDRWWLIRGRHQIRTVRVKEVGVTLLKLPSTKRTVAVLEDKRVARHP